MSCIVEEKVLNTYRGKSSGCIVCLLRLLCSGHSDAVLAVAAHPTSESIFITSSRVTFTMFFYIPQSFYYTITLSLISVPIEKYNGVHIVTKYYRMELFVSGTLGNLNQHPI